MKEFIRTVEERQSFTKNQWNRLSDEERETWEPVDGSPDWPEVKKLSKDEAMKRMVKTAQKKNTDNLRIKPGQKFNLAGAKVVVLKWGPNWHLVEMKHNSGKEGYGLLKRTARDSSYGIQDTMDLYQQRTSFDTLQEAEEAYISSNS